MNTTEDKSTTNILIMRESKADGKGELFAELARTVAEMPDVKASNLCAEEIEQALLQGDSASSTELGSGLIFPHARMSRVHTLNVVFVPFAGEGRAIAGFRNPVRLACMMLIPKEMPMGALKFMSRVADCVKNSDCRERLCRMLADGDLEKLTRLLDVEAKKILSANDLMREWRCELTPEMPLKEATQHMLAKNVNIVPVLREGCLAGELSCAELFKLGIPDFFTHLKSVGFIRYFDPFENYFAKEARSCTADVMNTNPPMLPPDATLIEIVFMIVVEKHPLLYIVDTDRRLLGVIDSALILERIINI